MRDVRDFGAATAHRQLALPFGPGVPLLRAAAFLPAASNQDACRWASRPEAWPGGRLVVCGGAGVGKSHLLNAWADRQGAMLLEGASLRHLPGFDARAVALDDADMVPHAETLLHLLNAAAEQSVSVLLAGRLPASRWPVGLPDLASRLRAIVSVDIHQPEDALLRALLARQLADRQLAVSPAVQDWLLLRLPRTGAALCEAAARLDRAALAAGRAIDRSVAARVVLELSGIDDPPAERLTVDSLAMPSLL